MADFIDYLNFFNSNFGSMNTKFRAKYRVYPISLFPNKSGMENGGKILLPPSAVEIMHEMQTPTPFLFCLTNSSNGAQTHCGVLEFIAEEGRIYIPSWMMRNLGVKNLDVIQLESVTLPIATEAKFQPQTLEFLDVDNPKTILENSLRNYSCLTVGDLITIVYGKKTYPIKVISTGNEGSAINIIECDLKVDFDPPPGYVETTLKQKLQNCQEANLLESTKKQNDRIQKVLEAENSKKFKAFNATGARVDGKERKAVTTSNETKTSYRGIPDYNFTIGTINFIRKEIIKNKVDVKDEEKTKIFGGASRKIGYNKI